MKTRKGKRKRKRKMKTRKAFMNSKQLMEVLVLVKNLEDLLNSGNIQDTWKESRALMVPKRNKTKVNDLRSISPANVSYKIAKAIIR